MIPNSFGNVIAWCLTLAGGASFFAATVGLIYFLALPKEGTRIEMPNTLDTPAAIHDQGIVIKPGKFTLCTYAVCALLAVYITWIGYIHTNLFTKRMLNEQKWREQKWRSEH